MAMNLAKEGSCEEVVMSGGVDTFSLWVSGAPWLISKGFGHTEKPMCCRQT